MTEALVLRPIRREDDPLVAAIIRTVMPEFGAGGPGFAIHDPEVDHMSVAYDRPGAAYWVVEREGRVLGGGGFAPLDGGPADTCEVRKMYFLPEARRRGTGAKLLATILDGARASGYRRAYLETLERMEQARRLYRSFGFEPLPAPLGATGHFGCDSWCARPLTE